MNEPENDKMFNVNRLNQRILKIIADMMLISENVRSIINEQNEENSQALIDSIVEYQSDSDNMLNSVKTTIKQLESGEEDITVDVITDQKGGQIL